MNCFIRKHFLIDNCLQMMKYRGTSENPDNGLPSLNYKTKVTLTSSGNVKKSRFYQILILFLFINFMPFLICFSKLFTKHINIIFFFKYSLQEKYFVGYFECQNISLSACKTVIPKIKSNYRFMKKIISIL